jgi:hypothetical protein
VKFGNYCLEEAFNDPDELVRKFKRTIIEDGFDLHEFDTLVGTGFSGALVVPTLARATGRDFLIVRKPNDSHHHGSAIAEGNYNDSGNWLFVDDGIGTGKTYTRVRHAVNKLATSYRLPDNFQGAYLYGHDAMHPAQILTPRDLEGMGIHPYLLDAEARSQLDSYRGEDRW